MRFIPTKIHGIADYVTAVLMLLLPRVTGASPVVTRMMTGMAFGRTTVTMLTDFELGVVRRIPVPVHLTIDGVRGAFLCLAPFLFRDESTATRAALFVVGLGDIIGAMLTETEPRDRPRRLGDRVREAVEHLRHAA